MKKKKGKASDGLPIPKPPGKALTEAQAKARFYRTQRKKLRKMVAASKATEVDVTSYDDFASKIRLLLNQNYDSDMGPIRIFRASLSVEELNAKQRAEFNTEDDLRKYLEKVSNDMEEDKGNPIVDYCLRVEDKKKRVLFQYFGRLANLPSQYMGIPQRFIDRLAGDMQAFMSTYPPGKRSHIGDARHSNAGAQHVFDAESLEMPNDGGEAGDGDGDVTMGFTTEAKVVLVEKREGNGVAHLVQAWPPQGQYDHVMPSNDYMGAGSASRFQAGQCFLAQSYDIQEGVSLRLAAVDSEMHEEMTASFLAGRYTHVMPGPYLGVACLYKLPVGLHIDRNDFGLSSMLNGGDYVGGVLHVPQLGLKLRYNPGDTVFLRAQDLWHEIREWMATVKPLGSDNTEANPGRVAMVFFTHQAAHELLKDKESNWLLKTFNQKSYRQQEQSRST